MHFAFCLCLTGKLSGLKTVAERNTFAANEWRKLDSNEKIKCEEETKSRNELCVEDLNEAEVGNLVKKTKKKAFK